MRTKFILLLSCIILIACEHQENGFTNKVEAKNGMASGLKEGKWIEYDIPQNSGGLSDTVGYNLIVYKAGKPFGIERYYSKNGKILSETPYKDGITNGIQKLYYKSGELECECPITNGKRNGLVKRYFKNGQVMAEFPFQDGIMNGTMKGYYESGKIGRKAPYENDKINGTDTGYYESGKIKSSTFMKMVKKTELVKNTMKMDN